MATAADSHDLIRVHGARVNNLKDVTVELPKRRLTRQSHLGPSGIEKIAARAVARLGRAATGLERETR